MIVSRDTMFRLWTTARDESGAIGPMVAVMGPLLLAFTAFALDVGLYYTGNRQLRIATEAAALAAAGQLTDDNARSRALLYLSRNGYADPSILKQVKVGYYCANDNLKAASNGGARFVTSSSPELSDCPGSVLRQPNAVRIVTGRPSKQFLAGIFGEASPIPQLTATASAARIDEAGISATSGLLEISNPLVTTVNTLLGKLLGVQLTLSTAKIEALLAGNVDAGLFFDALADRVNFKGTYGELVLGSYQLKDIANAAASAAGSNTTKSALEELAHQAPANYSVPLKGLFSVGVWKNMLVGDTKVAPALRAGLNSYQLISYAVQDGPVVLDVGAAIQPLLPKNLITGSEVKVGLAVSGHDNRPRFAFGPAGEAKVGTSMIRLKVDVTLVNLPLGIAKANIPVLLDVASAEAEVSGVDGINCVGKINQDGNTTVRVSVKSALVKAYVGDYYVGNVKTNPLIKPLPPIYSTNIRQTAIVDAISLKPLLGLGAPTVLSLKGKAVVEPVLGSGEGATLTFGPGLVGSPTAPGTGLTIPNSARIGTTVDKLVGSLTGGDGRDTGVQLCLLDGICGILDIFGVKSQLLPAITAPLTAVVSGVVDPLLDTVLVTLGIQLGHEKAWVNGVRCGTAVLI